MTPRLFVEHPLFAEAVLPLAPEQARKLSQVLRLGAGSRIRAFNGRDGEWSARLVAQGKRDVAAVCEAQMRPQNAAPDLLVLFAPVKRAGTDWIVEKATELGARTLQPVLTRRTQSETVRIDRLALIAREAAEQCERLETPDVRPALALAAALEGWDETRPLVFADEAGDDPRLAWGGPDGRALPILAAAEARAPRPARFAFLTGPEGGFDRDERRWLASLPAVIPVSLGPRILRAETAVCAGLAVLQAVWGDGRKDDLREGPLS
jgi:16S rRNA (uracil1498-N3)-methyltransferase